MFEQRQPMAITNQRYNASTQLPSGERLMVTADGDTHLAELRLFTTTAFITMVFTQDEARAVAQELLSAADALEG